ncbi:hypothetical protein DM860_003576 [Cuscuta australis]|uniref:Glycine-rich protein n=1 Tax=Cuscuta australis TaxID=267555 RepID=A0A328DGH1_9ASTE|nr:hypothetical protein DM860_003576 [Cuscuta australis]
MMKMRSTRAALILAFFLILTATRTSSTRPDPDLDGQAKHGGEPSRAGGGRGGDFGGFFGPGPGFSIPGFGGGYGSGFGGPGGGYGKGGVVRPPAVVCKEKGPCRGKKLTCPAKCYKSFSRSGKGYGGGGGGGSCTVDCTKKCAAYC